MNILKITLLGSAILFSGAAFAAAPAAAGFGEPATYAQVASPAAPAEVALTVQAAPADVTVVAWEREYYGDGEGGYHGGGYRG